MFELVRFLGGIWISVSLWTRAFAARLRCSLLWLVALAGLVSPCLPPPPLTATPFPSPTTTTTITPSPTTTIIWFPPTHTFTPFPTFAISPTQDFRPDPGPLILEDDFTDQAAWQIMRTETGSIAFGNQELTLAVASPGGVLQSLRQSPVLNDFYLEIDLVPSLCRAGDIYGLLLRASSTQDVYRLLVNCDGQLVGLAIRDAQGRLQYGNEAWCRIRGMSLEQILESEKQLEGRALVDKTVYQSEIVSQVLQIYKKGGALFFPESKLMRTPLTQLNGYHSISMASSRSPVTWKASSL